jgi:hypothetical protein
MKFRLILVLWALICVQNAFCTHLDLEEKSRKFTVKKRDGRPSWIPEDASTTTIVSLGRRSWECYVPPVSMGPPKSHVQPEDGGDVSKDWLDQKPTPIGGEEFIRSKSAECMYLHTGEWFMYEFCPFKKTRQFHMENGVEKIGFDLGFYDEEGTKNIDFDKIYSHALSLDDVDRSNLYLDNKITEGNGFSFVYSKGTICDLNGEHRKTTVHYHCEKGSSSFPVTSQTNNDAVGLMNKIPTFKIEEPQPCEYEIHLFASFMCEHPVLHARLSSESVDGIECWKLGDETPRMEMDDAFSSLVEQFVQFLPDDVTETTTFSLEEVMREEETNGGEEVNVNEGDSGGDDPKDVTVEDAPNEL